MVNWAGSLFIVVSLFGIFKNFQGFIYKGSASYIQYGFNPVLLSLVNVDYCFPVKPLSAKLKMSVTAIVKMRKKLPLFNRLTEHHHI